VIGETVTTTEGLVAILSIIHPLFLHIQHYDDKVDIWSIGALLYKVIVGQCGFYAVS
jgi:serine/threonine protein kinase